MNTKTNLLSIMACAMTSLMIVGCADSADAPTADNGATVLRINAVYPGHSRATATSFETDDEIGVFVSDEAVALQPFGNMVNNGRFRYDGSIWSPARSYYWNEGTYNVYAYYPYQDAVNDTEDYAFKVCTDQSNHAAFTASDFLCARAEGVKSSTEPVNLTFSHVLTRVVVEVAKSDNYEGEIPADLEAFILNTVTTANVNLATGSTVKDAYASTETIKMNKIASDKFEAVVVPQRIDTRRPIVEIISGNISYLMEGIISFKQGFQHTITVTLTANPQQAEIEIGGGINNWN